MTTWSSRTNRFVISLGAAGMLAAFGCVGGDGVGSGPNDGFDPIGTPGDDDDDDVNNPNEDATTIEGVVRDAFGMPIQGALVSTDRGDYEGTSDHNGRFVLSGLDGSEDGDDLRGERVLVNVTADGYAHTQTPIEVMDGVANTMLQTLAEVDLETTFDAADGLVFEIEEGGPQVTLPGGNFVDANGNAYNGVVNLEATFYDLVSDVDNGNELFATPGDFTAIDFAGDDQTLESFGMFQVNMTDAAGNELNLAGETAPVVMPIQSLGSAPAVGSTVPAWSYDLAQGKWVEEAIGTVIELEDGTLAWEFEAPHFSTWNCDQPLPTHGCVTGQVTNSQGTPRQGATVRAVGLTYVSTTTARTAQDGSFCLEVKNGETVWLEVSYTIGGQPATQRTDPVTIPAGQATCTDGDASDCIDIGVLPIDIMSCVAGVVISQQNQPISQAQVVSPEGGIADTQSDGSFCLAVPVFQQTTVYVLTEQDQTAFQPVQVYTQPGQPSCSAGCSNVAVMRPYTSTGCVQGSVTIDSQSIQSIPVEVYDASFPDVRVSSTLTASDGSFCADVPTGGEFLVQVGSGENICGAQSVSSNAAAGNTCDSSDQGQCMAISSFDCSSDGGPAQ